MRTYSIVVIALLFGLFYSGSAQSQSFPEENWQVADRPEALGWSSEKLRAARAYAGTIDTAAVMIVADGIVVDQWGETTRKFNVHSVRKSLLSALIGIYEAEGIINLDSTLEELGINDRQGLSDRERQATLMDLLVQRTWSAKLIRRAGPRATATRPARSGTTATGTSTRRAPYSNKRPAAEFSRPSMSGSRNRWACRTMGRATACMNQGVASVAHRAVRCPNFRPTYSA
jgi:CubicO group peptidase (beta-lactamase class C family)